MANHKSAQKSARQAITRAAQNKSRVSNIRTKIKKVETLIGSGHKEEASTALRQAESAMMKGVTKGVLHHNTASRKVSRLTKRLSTLTVA